MVRGGSGGLRSRSGGAAPRRSGALGLSRIFLDTSAYSAFKRGHLELRHRIREASQIKLNPVVLGELRAGFLKGNRLRENLDELAQFLASPRVTMVTVDEETAVRYAVILDPLRRAG